MKYIHVILVLIFLTSCQTNPPNSWEENDAYGKVFVSSNVTQAEIYIDNKTSGKTTPDTLTLSEGTYTISLQKDGYLTGSEVIDIVKDSLKDLNIILIEQLYKKIVLIEDFSNASCGPCVTSNNILRSLKKSYGSDKLVAVKYAANFPSPNDPMYLANTEDSDARLEYYTIFSTPTIIVDGVNKTIATDSMSIKSIIDASLQQVPKFEIEVEDSSTNDFIFVNGKVILLDKSGIDFNSLVLHTIIIETEIEYSSPPGSNGETEFDDVMRIMLPNNSGFSITNIESEIEIEFNWSSNIDSRWNKEELEVIVFVQHSNSKEIYQANSTIN